MAREMVTPPPDAARHLKVLRPKAGEEIELFDGHGRTRRYRWEGGSLRAVGELATSQPPPVRLTLFACVTKGSRWDWTIEKAVELGVARIVPVISERCIVRLAANERAAKAERWRRIAADAARQSDAVWLPEVREAVDFPVAVGFVKECGRVFAGALTSPPPPPMWTAVADALAGGAPSDMGVFVGPEGDFTPAELVALLEELRGKCSVLLLSDVGCAAVAAYAALEAASMNVFVNTRTLPEDPEASEIGRQASDMLACWLPRAWALSDDVMAVLRTTK